MRNHLRWFRVSGLAFRVHISLHSYSSYTCARCVHISRPYNLHLNLNLNPNPLSLCHLRALRTHILPLILILDLYTGLYPHAPWLRRAESAVGLGNKRFRVQGLGFRVYMSWLWCAESALGLEGLGFSVYGLGFRF
jgi:hypothetical protein